MAERQCHYCGSSERELRPYGPGGSWLCFPCLKETPEREAAAGAVFAVQLDAAEAIGQGFSVASPSGPNPAPEALRRLVGAPAAVSPDTQEHTE